MGFALNSVVLDPIYANLAHVVYVTIVIDKMQLASPIQVLPALRLVKLHLQGQRQDLAIVELEHSLHLRPSLVLVHLESGCGPIEHVDQLATEVRVCRRAVGGGKVAHQLALLLAKQELLFCPCGQLGA